MSGGTPIVGPWPNSETEGAPLINIHVQDDESTEQTAEDSAVFSEVYDEPEHIPFATRAVRAACIIAAILWVAAAGWAQYLAWSGTLPSLTQLTDFVPRLAMPLVLIGLIWLLFARTPRAVMQRMTQTVDSLRVEEERFGSLLITYADQVREGRAALAEQAHLLETTGTDASARLSAIRDAVQQDVAGIATQSAALKANAADARAELAILLADLPKAQTDAVALTGAFQQAGLAAHEKAGALDVQLAALSARSREAEELAGGAAQKLAAHLARMDGMSETAAARMADVSAAMSINVDATLARAADALALARTGLESQGVAMLAMVEQGNTAMANAGAGSAATLASRVAEIVAQVEGMTVSLDAQDSASQNMLERIAIDVAKVEDRIAALGHGASKTGERAGEALLALQSRAEALSDVFAAGSTAITGMTAEAEGLLGALDSTAREIDETLPASFARLKQTAEHTKATARGVLPALEALDTTSESTLARLQSAETLVAAQAETVSRLSEQSSLHLAAAQSAIAEMNAALETLEERTRGLTETAAPELLAAVSKVRETAEEAGLEARNAISAAIPVSIAALASQSQEAVNAALSAQVEAQVSKISGVTERAVAAAKDATAALIVQIEDMAERAGALEARVAEANEQVSKSDETVFARRVALLIESLNSTAIDVTKLLSNDVTDTAWAAYLRGDRGVFTRRAVRLLDTGEVRTIARHYDDDAEFREQVNRYIHDFEAMLRNILATREGGPLSVTLLSSDAGKLYVALAQAIDRLRT